MKWVGQELGIKIVGYYKADRQLNINKSMHCSKFSSRIFLFSLVSSILDYQTIAGSQQQDIFIIPESLVQFHFPDELI